MTQPDYDTTADAIDAASGLRRATTEAGVALPIDYSQAVAAAAGLTRAAELGVTRLGVVIHTRPSIDRELPVVVGYADGRGRWSRDGHRHTTTTAPDFSQRGSDAVNGPHGNRPTPPRLTVIARPDTVIEAHGHQAGSPYKGTLDVTAVAIAAIRSGQVDRYCPVTQSGRELSKFQLLRILAVHPSAPVLAFDGDLAGRDSAGRYGQAFTAHGRTVVVTTLPAAHDPASWLAEHGYAGLQAWSGRSAGTPRGVTELRLDDHERSGSHPGESPGVYAPVGGTVVEHPGHRCRPGGCELLRVWCVLVFERMCWSVGVNLSEWADRVGVNKYTAYRWYREGNLPVPARRVGKLILVDIDAATSGGRARTVIYARVSSHVQRADLDRQVARLASWATSVGMAVDEVVAEVGSGVNGKRRKFQRVLADPTAQTIVVEHRDRLARFGVENLESALSAQGRRVVVSDPGETDDDLVWDMTEVLTSFCARLYGRRGARNRAVKALGCAKNDVGPAALTPPSEAGW